MLDMEQIQLLKLQDCVNLYVCIGFFYITVYNASLALQMSYFSFRLKELLAKVHLQGAFSDKDLFYTNFSRMVLGKIFPDLCLY